MDTIPLSAERRTTLGKKTAQLRLQGKVPAVIYGQGKPAISLTLDQREFERVFTQAGESSLVDLRIEGESPVKVLIQDVQLHPVTDRILHADFHEVSMTEKIETEITLKFEGEPVAVAELGGVLLTNLESLKIECLPGDLVHEILVSLEPLKTFEDQIRVSDLKIPKGMTVLEKPETVVAVVTPPRSEEELKELDTEVVENVSEIESAKPKPEAEDAEAAPEAEAKKE
jgi:large subunit ribosomal protein L25